jgi:hypothetical protein
MIRIQEKLGERKAGNFSWSLVLSPSLREEEEEIPYVCDNLIVREP